MSNIKTWIINNLFNKLKNPDTTKFRKKWFKDTNNSHIYESILNETSFLNEKSYFSERIYCILHDIKKNKKCYSCDNKVKYLDFNRGYRKYCSFKCSNNCLEKQKKIEETMTSRYGHKNSMQVPIFKEKAKQTCLEKYGTNICSKNYNVINKMKQTCLKKYETNCSLNNTLIKEKKIKTWNNNYKNGHPLNSNKVKNKIKKTCIKKYGVTSPSQRHINKNILFNCLDNPNWLKEKHHKEKKSCSLIAKENNINKKLIIKRLKKFNIKQILYPNSIPEKEIIEFINIKNIEINNRKIISPYELDIYIPDYKLAIEFNGLYWHSNINQNYHLNKTELCNKQNIQLLHIFENEWIDSVKQDIWKSIINNKLNKNTKIFARKCEIKEIDNNLATEFLNNNHLQGYCSSSIKLGLFYNNELMSLMTFGKTRFSKKYEWEMIRFCNKKFFTVVGGASRLYKYFINNYKPKNVISYADRRYSNGNLYEKLGFEFSHYSKPNYQYFKNGSCKLHNRVKFQKHKLNNLLESFDNNKSEIENMINNGFRRIWDCGNSIYIK